MARVKLSDELKEAIRELPDKEKDKLIFRLLPSNSKLVDRLIFELLEDGSSQEERRAEMEAMISRSIQSASNTYYSPGYLLLDIRDLSGQITRHVNATKDKYGEVSLNLLMVIETIRLCGERMSEARPRKARTLNDYLIKRTLKILKLINKLHPDLHLDFTDQLEELGQLIGHNHPLMKNAIFHGLDVNWLIRGEIPEHL